jgi:hypothetical protein
MLENIRVLLRDTTPSTLAYHPEWAVDAVLGGLINHSDTIVITGFWRSGTTWLLETIAREVGAKPVFEPFMTDTTGYKSYVDCNYKGSEDARRGFMPFCSGDLSSRPVLRDHLHRSLTGAVPGPFVRAARFNIRDKEGRSDTKIDEYRNRIRDALRMRVVAKFTRAHLLLPRIQDEVAAGIHIRRDPRAVTESLLRQVWAEYLKSMSLEDYLLSPDDGRFSAFQEWTDEIRRCDEEGPISRIVGYWALVEQYIDDVASDAVVTVEFERLCREGIGYLNNVLRNVGSLRVSRANLGGESKTSDHKKSTEWRINGWKERLRREEVRKIESVVRRFEAEEWLG